MSEPQTPAPTDLPAEADPTAEAPAIEPTAPPAAEPGLGPAAAAALLAERFPALFTPGQLKPLKLKIQADIQARLQEPEPVRVTRKVLSIVLQRHTTSTAYLRALSQATHRFDLDGQPAGEVAEEHRNAALAEVERRRAIVAERRAAERAASREASKATGQPTGLSAEHPTGDGPGRPDRRERNRPRGTPSRNAHPRHATHPTGGPAAPRPARPGKPEGPAHRKIPAQAEQAHQQREAEGSERAARATLLRAWETTTLTRANFCALKGLREAELEAMLAQAAQERDQRLAAAPKPGR